MFVDTDSDIRLVRRLQRDIMERGRDIVGVIKQYNKFVKPAFEQYIEPTVQVADIVVPRGETVFATPNPGIEVGLGQRGLTISSALLAGGENSVALDLIVQHVHSQLEKVRGGLQQTGAACGHLHLAGAVTWCLSFSPLATLDDSALLPSVKSLSGTWGCCQRRGGGSWAGGGGGFPAPSSPSPCWAKLCRDAGAWLLPLGVRGASPAASLSCRFLCDLSYSSWAWLGLPLALVPFQSVIPGVPRAAPRYGRSALDSTCFVGLPVASLMIQSLYLWATCRRVHSKVSVKLLLPLHGCLCVWRLLVAGLLVGGGLPWFYRVVVLLWGLYPVPGTEIGAVRPSAFWHPAHVVGSLGGAFLCLGAISLRGALCEPTARL